MSFSGLFAIGLSGVNAHAAGLETVSQNIANTQTAGYKRARTDFSTLVTSLAPQGGIEGGGVKADNRTIFSEQGAITRTASSTDLAISGDGFFVVSDEEGAGAPVSLTRSGGFNARSDGLLVNSAGYFLRANALTEGSGAGATPGGLATLQNVNINALTELSEASANIGLAGVLSADAAPGETTTRNIAIVDEAGDTRTLALTFASLGGGAYQASAAFADGGGAPIAEGVLAFTANGNFDADASTFPASLTANGQTLAVDFNDLTLRPGATQFTRAEADGAALGALTGVEISRDGVVTANFANGLSRDLYQIAIANVVNEEGLEEGPNSTYLLTSQAGAVSLDNPRTGRAGAVEASALELSTVNIGQEFSTLIETQRAYAANTRIISIADELWRTLTQTAA